MGKTPDEIKKGLECGRANANTCDCKGCPYCDDRLLWHCQLNLMADALALIQRLERQNNEMWSDNLSMQDALTKQERFRSNLQERISQLEAQGPRWISVEERLPKHDGWVLAIVNGEHGITTFYDAYMLARYYPRDGWLIDGYEDWETPDVSFWLPLPEPPKEESPIGGNSDDFVHGNHG